MADFSVDGLVSAKDTLSDTMDDIARSISGASREAGEGAVAFSELAGVGDVAEQSMEGVEDSIDDVNSEIKEAIGNMQLMSASMTEVSSVAELMDNRMSKMDADPFINHPEFKESFRNKTGFSEEQFGGMKGLFRAQGGGSLEDFIQSVSKRKDVDLDMEELITGVQEAAGDISFINERLDSMEDEAEEAGDDVSSLSRRLFGLSGAALASTTPLGAAVMSVSRLEEGAEDAEREIRKLTDALHGLLPALSTMSANLGPFNIGLQNVLITLPTMVAMVGPLVTAVAALATAFVAATAAVTAFMAVGLVQFAQTLEENFAGVKNTTEALTQIFKGLKKAFWEALGPLRNAEFAGMGGIELFIRGMQNLVKFTEMLSEAFAELLQMREVENFFFRIEQALFSGDDGSTVSMIESLKSVIRTTLPYVTAFAVWFINKLPEAMMFMANTVSEVGPSLQEFGSSLLHLVVILTHVGAGFLSLVLPALSVFISTLADAISTVNQAMQALGPFGDILAYVGIATVVLIALFIKVMAVVQNLVVMYEALTFVTTKLSISTWGLVGSITALLSAVVILTVGLAMLTGHLDVLPGKMDQAIGGALTLASALYLAAQAAFALQSVWTWFTSTTVGSYLTAGVIALAEAAGLSVGAFLLLVTAVLAVAVALGWVILNMQKTIDMVNRIEKEIKSLDSRMQAFLVTIGKLSGFLPAMYMIREILKFILDPEGTLDDWLKSLNKRLTTTKGILNTILDIMNKILSMGGMPGKTAAAMLPNNAENFPAYDKGDLKTNKSTDGVSSRDYLSSAVTGGWQGLAYTAFSDVAMNNNGGGRQQGQTRVEQQRNVTVNVDNGGGGSIDDRQAHFIGEAVLDKLRQFADQNL